MERDPDLPKEDIRWYCVRTKRFNEGVSSRALRSDIGLEVFCPMIRYQRSRQSGKIWVVEALFPNYIFSRFDLPAFARRVSLTRGVLRIVSFGGPPIPVSDEVIAELKAQFPDERTFDIDSEAHPGDEVQVISGPFRGIQALVTRVLPAKQRIAILLDLLGMEREVEVSTDQILPPQKHPLLCKP